MVKHFHSFIESKEMVECLLENYADVNLDVNYGKLGLETALENGISYILHHSVINEHLFNIFHCQLTKEHF